ncbi:hypothetical protein D3C83_03840 [compost metagenome]
MPEKPLAAGQQVVYDLEVFEQQPVGDPLHAFLRTGQIAVVLGPGIRREMRVYAGGAEGHQRDRPDLLRRVGRQQSRPGEAAVNPDLEGDVLRQRLAVDDEHRHLVLGVQPQELGGPVLPVARVDGPDFEFGAGLGERHEGHQRAGHGGKVERQLHLSVSGKRGRILAARRPCRVS